MPRLGLSLVPVQVSCLAPGPNFKFETCRPVWTRTASPLLSAAALRHLGAKGRASILLLTKPCDFYSGIDGT